MGTLFGVVLFIIGVFLCIVIAIGLIWATIFVGQFIYSGIRNLYDPGYSERKLAKLKEEQKEMRDKHGPPFWEKAWKALFGGTGHNPCDTDMYGNLMYPEEFEEFVRKHRDELR